MAEHSQTCVLQDLGVGCVVVVVVVLVVVMVIG